MANNAFRGAVVLCAGLLSCGGSKSDGATNYFPTATGTGWNFRVTAPPTTSAPNGSSYSVSMQVTQGSSSAVTIKSSGSNLPMTYLVQTFEITDTGVLESSSLLHSATTDAVTSGSSYSPPTLILPSNTGSGSTASSTSTVTPEGAGAVRTYMVTRDIVVNGVESVTVPAGTFSALKVTTHVTGTETGGFDAYNVQWYGEGVGHVKIVNYPTATPAATTTWELTSRSP
jgi:hypothetical protein